MVQVGINGQGPFPFVLDTGATVTCVDERLAAELELPEAAGTIAVGAGIGGAGTMRLVRLESVEVGDAAARGLHGCVLNLEAMNKAGLDIRGLLGLNFLKSYLVTIDFERSTVRLQPPGAAAPD